MRDFTFYNPTKIYFGKDSLNSLDRELPLYGKNILLIYGSGSIKKNGVYEAVVNKLKLHKKTIFEDSNVPPNPTIEKMQEGLSIARKNKIDLVLAVGGGSVIDYAKCLAALVNEKGDLWTRFLVNQEKVTAKNIPLATILTMVGTGSEMNGGSVISNATQKQKLSYNFAYNCYPKFSIVNPLFTLSVPSNQMTAGIFDILSHVLEQYLSSGSPNTSDYVAEGLMRSLIDYALVAIDDPLDYDARSNLAWTSTLALNSLLSRSKSGDWNVHQISHGVSAVLDTTHGKALAAICVPYYNLLLSKNNKDCLSQFVRFAVNVWGISPAKKTNIATAKEGIQCLENFIKKIGLPIRANQFVKTQNIQPILKAVHLSNSGYEKVSLVEVEAILNCNN